MKLYSGQANTTKFSVNIINGKGDPVVKVSINTFPELTWPAWKRDESTWASSLEIPEHVEPGSYELRVDVYINGKVFSPVKKVVEIAKKEVISVAASDINIEPVKPVPQEIPVPPAPAPTSPAPAIVPAPTPVPVPTPAPQPVLTTLATEEAKKAPEINSTEIISPKINVEEKTPKEEAPPEIKPEIKPRKPQIDLKFDLKDNTPKVVVPKIDLLKSFDPIVPKPVEQIKPAVDQAREPDLAKTEAGAKLAAELIAAIKLDSHPITKVDVKIPPQGTTSKLREFAKKPRFKKVKPVQEHVPTVDFKSIMTSAPIVTAEITPVTQIQERVDTIPVSLTKGDIVFR